LYDDIIGRIGEVDYYVNEKVGAYNKRALGLDYCPPVVVTDDDITGTFIFLRALKDYGCDRNITAEQIGKTWLNYIVENRSVFWWGGMGNSTEHTAYLRLKNGIAAPASGSIRTNGKTVAEQIGSQIFIDGWAMVAPGDPEYAADLARRAASVSHDGEAIYGAQVIAAMEAAAFIESDIEKLLDIGTSQIPANSQIRAVIEDVRSWHTQYDDWRDAFARIREKYGYDKYFGNVHIIPNHALVVLSLLYGENDFRRTMKMVNTAGWDTDCNSANVGCLLGIKNGLACFESGLDWRGPVADRMLMPTADGGGAVTDAVRTALDIIEIGSALAGEEMKRPGADAPFNFCFPGSLQGFHGLETSTTVTNVPSDEESQTRCLHMDFDLSGSIATPVFIQPNELTMAGYQFMASPAVYSGQELVAEVRSRAEIDTCLFISVYTGDGKTQNIPGPSYRLKKNTTERILMAIPDTEGQPIAEIGIEARSGTRSSIDILYVDWKGEPKTVFKRPPAVSGAVKDIGVWRRAWVNGVDQWESHWREAFRLCQNSGRGLLIQGTQGWRDYEVESELSITMAASAGIAIRVQGMRRYYALLISNNKRARLVKYDDREEGLGIKDLTIEEGDKITLRLRAEGTTITAWYNGTLLFQVVDAKHPLTHGAAAFVLEEGHVMSEALIIRP
jgi:hypothetical protein